MDEVMDEYGNYSYSGYDYPYDMYGEDYQDWLTYSFPEDIAAKSINLYLPPCLLLIGTTGNILSAIVLARLTSRVSTTCFYLTLMARIRAAIEQGEFDRFDREFRAQQAKA